MEIRGIHYLSDQPVSVTVKDGIISKVSELRESSGSLFHYIAPGLIDNQVNGYNGVDFSSLHIDRDSLVKAAEGLWRDGVTSFVPTVVTGSHDNLVKSFQLLSGITFDTSLKGTIPGFHLEGPYLSKEAGYYGCHPAEHLRDPSWKEFCQYQEAAGGRIIQVTLAPELEGAFDFIKRLRRKGIVVAIGHTNANAEQINRAVECGARISTHLGNGCASLIHRHYNPLWPQLANDRLVASLIADGHHLIPEEIKVFCRMKRFENIILTSDVTFLIGMPPGYYEYMGSKIVKTESGLIENPALNCLAGSSMPLKKGIETVLSVTGCGLDDAVHMAGRNAARELGLKDRGKLEEGMRADIILFGLDKNSISMEKTYLKGELVFTR